MKELLFNTQTGDGKYVNENTKNEVVVLRAGGLYNLGLKRKGGATIFVVENKKRLSTLQKYLDGYNYDIKIKEV